ncbi:MAG: glycosyltransferase family 9 protein [Ignavibacteriae bacterium]|nr:glycosyltransferase family 9 protein [Ignavibacteria bacterium]MBI3363618.1 glycosyltransferase family 9 protein [Ignavibacteriota bacterium]
MAEMLKKHFPSVQIGMLIQRYTEEIVEANRAVDEVLFYDDGKYPLPLFHLVATLRTGRFDAVFHTHPRFRLALITWFARVPVRVGTGYRWYSFLFNRKVYEHRKDAKRHELEYNLNLLTAIGCPVDYEGVTPSLEVKPHVVDRVKSLLVERGIQKNERIVILHPGSGGSARDWSPQNFGKLGQCLAQLPHVRIIVTGGASEQNLVHEVQSIAGEKALTMVNQLNLKELAALAKLSSLFVANSTGPLHIAAAVGTPVIGFFPNIKPLSAERWGPYTSKKTIFTPINRPHDCSDCMKNNTSCECMNSISVDDVYKAAIQYLTN